MKNQRSFSTAPLCAALLLTGLCVASRVAPAAPTQTAPVKAPAIAKMLGTWRGMTRMQRADEPMFTFALKAQGVWTDLTFGQKYAKNAKYRYDPKTGALTLFSAANNVLYKLQWQPATKDSKERLVEQVEEKELYRALVCYRYQPSP